MFREILLYWSHMLVALERDVLIFTSQVFKDGDIYVALHRPGNIFEARLRSLFLLI